jgi:hypothetical protein
MVPLVAFLGLVGRMPLTAIAEGGTQVSRADALPAILAFAEEWRRSSPAEENKLGAALGTDPKRRRLENGLKSSIKIDNTSHLRRTAKLRGRPTAGRTHSELECLSGTAANRFRVDRSPRSVENFQQFARLSKDH